MTRLRLLLLLVATIVGCRSPSEDAAKPTGAPESPSAIVTAESPPEPVPFETIPLATNDSYGSLPITDGANPGEIREFTNLKIKFCWCPPGTFQMGSSETAPNHLANERQFEVTLSKGFWIQQTELTQGQYEPLMGSNPSHFKGEQNPVESLTWTEAAEFGRRLSNLPPEVKAGNLFRLPLEAEWEYACRAGSKTAYCFGDDEAGLDELGWHYENSDNTTHPAGQKKPNAWAIHDLHGNVSEWCQDFYGEYPRGSATDPRGPKSGDKRILRGGGWFQVPMWARSAHRDAYPMSARYVGLGFRLVATNATRSDTREQSPDAKSAK